MTVSDLIKALSDLPRDAIVYGFNPDMECDSQVTGLILEPSDNIAGIPCSVTICTDDEDGES